jgi:putative transposase
VLDPAPNPTEPIAHTGIAPLLKQMIADYAATGLPPAYLPTPPEDPT